MIEANRERLGLDKPLTEQYTDWVKGIFVGRTYGSGEASFEWVDLRWDDRVVLGGAG
mgnify:CR=1 FL=1